MFKITVFFTTLVNSLNEYLSHFQLLKNIQLLMDASVALMNQYAIISAQFPPLQTPSTPSNTTSPTETEIETETATSTTTTTTTATPTTSENVETTKSDSEEKKTIASNITDDVAGPSTSQKTSSIETLEIDGNVVTIEDIGRNDPSDPNDPITEVRRRRLERFEGSNQES